MDADRVGMIVACLQLDGPEAITEWSEMNVRTQEDALNFAISLTAIAASWMVSALPIPAGALYAVPPGLSCRADADAHRAVVMVANNDHASASALLQGVVERGDLVSVIIHLVEFARAAVQGDTSAVAL
ncbi:hypothetical protein [Microbacterium sp. NPDC089696]|uniref:hypothetical protein n=1 Tax=Microbacterium sp. NPDC089696 TaxID=3364199 RepID=UPI00382462BD